LYGVRELPFFWEPFKSPLFTLFAIWLIPGLIAGLIGYLVFRNRIKGVYFSILTQAALLVFFNFFNGQQKLINGTNGLPTPNTILFDMMVGDPLMQKYFYYLSGILVIVFYFFSKWLVSKRFGSILIGIRDDEPRIRFSGYNPVLFKTLIFAFAGCLAGISGALFTVQADLISPQYMRVPFSIEMVIWVAVGGRGTLLGAILGAFFIRLGESFVQGLIPGGWIFIQGGLFILVVTVLPEGVIGWINNGGLRNLLTRLGVKRFIATYPSLEANKKEEN
jgi:urea transport system permease protein